MTQITSMFIQSLQSNKYNGFIRQNRSFILAFVKVTDIFIIISLYIYYLDIFDESIAKEKIAVLLCSTLTYEFFATINNLYSTPRGARFLLIIKNIFTAWVASVFIVLAFTSFTNGIENHKLHSLFYWLLTTPIFLSGWHLIVRLILVLLRKSGRNARRTAIAGATSLGLDIAHIITQQSWMGYNLMGFFDDRKPSGNRINNKIDLVGGFDEMINLAKQNKLDVIFITLPMCSEKRIKSILDELSDTSTVVYFIPNFFVFDLLGSKIENFNGLPAVCVYNTPHSDIDGFSKRLLDIVLSLIILAVIALPMLIIAIGVKLSSPGPVFFLQHRYGFRGEEIQVWKFRTMRVCEDGAVVKQATQGDPRITPFGQFLRRTSLDELPQFINALQGRMSIVGPRPHAVAHNELYRGQIKGYMLRHNVKPGITGLAQIRGFRGETDTLDKMEGRVHSDLEYIQNWSVWLDLEIVFLTIFKGFTDKNAY